MQEIIALCNNADTFPLNFDQHSPSAYNLSVHKQLDVHATRLFSSENESDLYFLELGSKETDTHATRAKINRDEDSFQPTCVKSESQLQAHLGLDPASRGPDPRCRFL